MDFFELSAEDLATLALVVAIGIGKKYTECNELGVLAVFFNGIGDNLGILQVQRLTLQERAARAQSGNPCESDC